MSVAAGDRLALRRTTQWHPGDPYPTVLVLDDTDSPDARLCDWQVRAHTAHLLAAIGEHDHASVVTGLPRITQTHLDRPTLLRRYVTALRPIHAAIEHRDLSAPGRVRAPAEGVALDRIAVWCREQFGRGSNAGAYAWRISHHAMYVAAGDPALDADAITASARAVFDDVNTLLRQHYGYELTLIAD